MKVLPHYLCLWCYLAHAMYASFNAILSVVFCFVAIHAFVGKSKHFKFL